ncbi:MAG: hypothetical protein IJW40_03310 [Clostridia bacterium]|nr:hypothetical protein [Clostridia bacterium]
MTIATKDFTQKDELIANLYVLKAGLVLIGGETKKIRDNTTLIERENVEIREREERILVSNDDLEFLIDNNKKPFEEEMEEAKKKRDSYLPEVARAAHPEEYQKIVGKELSGIWKVFKKAKEDEWNNYIVRRYSEFDDFIKGRLSYLAGVEDMIQEQERDINKFQTELSEHRREKERLTQELNNEILPKSTRLVKSIKEALDTQLQNILSEDDWENADLLIFYLQTGRADSLKEALILADRQRQTEQITNAIRYASEQISNQFRSSFDRLERVIDKCCLDLSNQINQNHVELMAASAAFVDSMNDTKEVIAMSAEELRQAVIDSSQKNSADLIQELRYNQHYWS